MKEEKGQTGTAVERGGKQQPEHRHEAAERYRPFHLRSRAMLFEGGVGGRRSVGI